MCGRLGAFLCTQDELCVWLQHLAHALQSSVWNRMAKPQLDQGAAKAYYKQHRIADVIEEFLMFTVEQNEEPLLSMEKFVKRQRKRWDGAEPEIQQAHEPLDERGLRAESERLRAENERLCAENQRLCAENERLHAHLRRLKLEDKADIFNAIKADRLINGFISHDELHLHGPKTLINSYVRPWM